MANIAVSIATAALPYVVQGVVQWGSKAAQTWGPAKVANDTIEAAAFTGSKFFGDNVVLSKIGSVAGRIIGLVSAPFVAQSAPVQGALGIGGQIAATAAGALVGVVGEYALNKLKGTPQKEEPKMEQLLNQQQFLQNQLQIERLKKMQAKLDSANKSASHVVIDNKQLERLAAELNIDVAELLNKLQPKAVPAA